MSLTVLQYYRQPAVRRRMLEFLGGNSLENATAVFLSRCDLDFPHDFTPRPVSDLFGYLDSGLDVGRSLWDRLGLLAHLDMEYVNFDFPAEPYLDPGRAFALQQPAMTVAVDLLQGLGLAPLHLLSGRGHHFVWQVSGQGEAFAELAKLGHLPRHMLDLLSTPRLPHHEPVSLELGRAFAGLGLVLEYLAHRIMASAALVSPLPVELTAVTVGPQQRGREIFSIDLSEYGDPLPTRMIRLPFSIYLKPWRKTGILHEQISGRIPRMFAIPVAGLDLHQAITTMRSPQRAAKLAAECQTMIPAAEEATRGLIAAYRKSSLARFHHHFYQQSHDPPEQWPRTYDATPLQELPPCVRHILLYPNELLLRPAAIRQVVVVLLALGWHPRHIAGLVRSKYERDFGWGPLWYIYDAASRADFYTRLFAGLIATGLDQLLDINCVSAAEKQLCFEAENGCSLEAFRRVALEGGW